MGEGAARPSACGAFRLGDRLVRPDLDRIEADGASRRIEPKVMDVLCLLAEEPGRVWPKEEILDRVWEGAHVTESVLTRAVAELRKALGDDASAPRYVETVPRRGYRLVAPVRAVDPSPATDGGTARSRVAAVAIPLLALLAVLAFAAGGWLLGNRSGSGAREGAGAGRVDASQPPAATGRRTQVTTTSETEAFPAFSPDGSTLAYAFDGTGRFELYLRPSRIDGAEDAASRPLRLTFDGADAVQPAFSPDGRWIAYHSVGRGGIWMIPALGGEPRQLVPFGSDPAWTPDGRRIVFQSGELTVVSLDTFPAFPPSTLWQVDLDPSLSAGEPRPLTRAGRPRGGHGAPAVSPDGRWTAFTSWDVGFSSLWLVPADGSGEPRRIDGVARPADPVFSADGRSLYAAEVTAQYRLVRVPLDPATGGAAGPAETASGITGRHLALSPDGRHLALSRLEMSSDLWSVPVEPSTGRRTGAEAPLIRDTSLRTSAPSFSPDGTRLSYGTKRAGLDPEIWTVDADGEDPRPLVAPAAGAFHSHWLEDGRMVFGAFVREGRELRAIDPATRRIERLALLPYGWAALDLDARGHRAAFHRSNGRTGSDVWIQRLDQIGREEPRRLTAEDDAVGFPSFSPDGRWLAVEVQTPASSQLAVVPTEPGDGDPTLRFLTSGPGHRWSYTWSPDGRWLVYSGLRDGRWNLYRVPFEGGPEEQVTTHEESLTAFVRYPDWSPAGDRIAYERRRTSGDLWVVEIASTKR